ncbi:MAG: cyclic nucleotide-binding domain-containing protein, partial [Hymenobacter sp.]
MSQLLALAPTALSGIAAFENLPAEVLTWLLQAGELRQYAAGEVVVAAGTPADRLLAVVSGGVQYYTISSVQASPVFRMEPGQVGGALPYSRLQTFKGQGVATSETTMYTLPRSQFPALEQHSPELVQRLVGIMNDRARDEVRAQERDDKLRALGKLSAGLSHELNNPAAAIGRAADALHKHLCQSPQLLKNLMLAGPPAGSMAALKALATASSEHQPPALSALARADQEDALADWLETQGVPDGYALATGLLDASLGSEQLGPL